MDEEERLTLRYTQTNMYEIGHERDDQAWSQENHRFNKRNWERAGTRLLASVMTKVLDHWDRLHRVFLREVFADRLPEAQEEHRQILGAIEAGDPDKVETVIRKHNRNALNAYEKYLEVRSEKWLVRSERWKAAWPPPSRGVAFRWIAHARFGTGNL
jgi:DNA-binding GntR family transcriptional regulator